ALAGFESTFMALTAELHRVALAVTETITASLGAQLPTQEAFEEHSSFLRINYYPLFDDASAGSELDRSFGIHPHTDAGAVTVLCQDEVASLQVHRGGQWETITKPKDALIINIGDIVQVWSNDRFTAPVHRVLARSDRTRFSIPYFLNPSYNYTYAPLAHEGHRYKPINWGEFRSQRSAGDYADLGDEIQISDFRIA
ncbi:MAG: isopenicillin N synthase-like dioxygenase, partial [Candidatus Azotimanducaceae bacterium]